jgi:hypothetical protein
MDQLLKWKEEDIIKNNQALLIEKETEIKYFL